MKKKKKNILVKTLETAAEINRAALGFLVPGLSSGKAMGALINETKKTRT